MSNSRLSLHTTGRVAYLFVWILLGALVWMAPVSARDDLHVVGGKVDWSGRLPTGWIGGNAQQIQRIAADTENATLRTLMSEMLLDARKLDVYFTHLDVTGTTSRTLSSLRVNTVPDMSGLADRNSRAELWRAYADLLRRDSPTGATVRVDRDEAMTTAGQPAYEVVFRTDLPSGGTLYTLMHFVTLPDRSMHLFQLRADTVKFRNREADLRGLLATLRYR